MTTWYDPDEIKYQATHDKAQPEFDPLHGADDPLNDDEGIRVVDDLPVEDDNLKDEVDDFVTGVNAIKTIVDGI